MNNNIIRNQNGGYNETKKNSQYVNLKINGRLFPSWVLANFSKYKLPEVFLDGSDPCNMKFTENELRKYQEFLGKFLNYNSPYRDMLIYHGLGSGKTRTVINIYNILYNYSPDWNVFILLKATMKDSIWLKELELWLQKEEKEFRMHNIEFISYDAPNADKLFLEKVKTADAAKKPLYIIEEAHNFIKNVYTNLSSKQGRRALTIYEHIIQEKIDNDSVRVLCISGSPAVNNPYELAILFNLLRPGSFPKSEAQFNQLFISTNAYPTLNPATKNMFQRRILGLVSYYIGATPDYYAKKILHYIDVPMSEYQTEVYGYYENIEEKMARKKRSGTSKNYKSYTRQACNFVFPLMKQGFTGETRPRPKDFKITEKIVENVLYGVKKEDDKKEKYYEASQYIDRVELFVKEFDYFLQTKLDNDLKNKHTLADDIQIFFEKTNRIFYAEEMIEYISKNRTSELMMVMYMCSAKMLLIVLKIMVSMGPILFYSNYVMMEGIQIFKIYLKYFGFSELVDSTRGREYFRHIEYHGGIDMLERIRVLDLFNKQENKLGALCKIIMISSAGAEGLNLRNVRQVHILEPFWNEPRIIQVIGRAIRQCSHKDLPLEDRVVDVFRYKSVRRTKDGGEKWTTDQYIEGVAISKEGLIQGFLDAIKEAAVDCVLNKAHNHLMGRYRCFQFEEKSLFDETVGPAYKEEIQNDKQYDNGLNSVNTNNKRIKVIRIKAVKQLKSDDSDENGKYSSPDDYWYDPESLTVYDYMMVYPIGKIGTSDGNIPSKIDNATYVINRLIPIPLIDAPR